MLYGYMMTLLNTLPARTIVVSTSHPREAYDMTITSHTSFFLSFFSFLHSSYQIHNILMHLLSKQGTYHAM